MLSNSEYSQGGGFLSDSIKALLIHNQFNQAKAGERMLPVIKGKADAALAVPRCQGEADLFRDKKEETAWECL